MSMRTFIVGSSHVTRLQKYIERGHDFRLQNHVISIEGISGGMVSSVYQYLIDIKLFQPDVIFLQIGSNDTSNRPEKVENVLLAVEMLLEILLLQGVQYIMFGLLFHRQRVVPRRGLTLKPVKEYNERVDNFNIGIYAITLKFAPYVIHWIHRGLQFPNCQILDDDGVHLSYGEGYSRFLSSLRGALLFAESHLLGNYFILRS